VISQTDRWLEILYNLENITDRGKEMGNILVKPPQIHSTAANLREHAKSIQNALITIDQIFTELPPDRFAGLSSATIRMRYTQKRDYMQSASSKVFFFAENLEKIAKKFEEADKTLNKGHSIGQILGASNWVPAGGIWKLGQGLYTRYLYELFMRKYADQFGGLEGDLAHFKKSKEIYEASRRNDLEFLKELDEVLREYKNHDNPLDFIKDKFGELLGLPEKYQEIRQSVLDRIANTDAKIAELDGKISTTEGQIEALTQERDAVLTTALNEPNTTYPVAPANANPIAKKGWCMAYVLDFRGQPPTPGGIERSGSAADLVTNEKYADLRYQVPASTPDLRDQVVPGTVAVWNKGQQGADATHGHAAVITEVGQDYVIVKESSWGSAVGAERRIPLNKLSELTLIGYNEVPRSR
jgi:uncharacterized protein YukE